MNKDFKRCPVCGQVTSSLTDKSPCWDCFDKEVKRVGDLRGQLANLRERALAGDDTAFEQIPDLANRLVNLARDIFGSTSDFAEQRDFAFSVLDQTGSFAESRLNKLLSEIEALQIFRTRDQIDQRLRIQIPR